MMIIDFIMSIDGMKFLDNFKEQFDCNFRIAEPSGTDLLLDVGEKTFKIPEDESIDEFKAAVITSVETGENILIERYKHYEVDDAYESDIEY